MAEHIKLPGWWAGIGLALLVSVSAGYLADCVGVAIMGFDKSPVSAIMMAMVLGMVIANTIVAGAGLMYEAQYEAPAALDIATITKLVRNLCMIAVIPMVAILYRDVDALDDGAKPNLLQMIPCFIVGLALMSALRTVGDMGQQPFGLLQPAQWHDFVSFTKETRNREMQ